MSTPQAISNRQYTAPPAASGVVVTPNSSAWTNSAYFTLIAATDAAIVLTGLSIQPEITSTLEYFEIDVATGAAASETVVTTIKGTYSLTYYCSPGYIPFAIPLDNIANGARVSVRLRKSNTSTGTWSVSATYYKKPLVGTMLTTAKPQKCIPSAATPTSLSIGASAYANSTWTQLVASTATDIVITSFVPRVSGFGGDDWEIDIGIGAISSEVVFATLKLHTTVLGGAGGPNTITLYTPYDAIVAGTRIAARTRVSTITSRTCNLAYNYIEKPL